MVTMRSDSFLDKFKLRTKLNIFLLVPVLTILIFSISNISMRYQELKDANNSLGFISISMELADLVHQLQRERGLSAGYVGSHGQQFESLLTKQRDNTDKQLGNFYSSLDSNDPNQHYWGLKDRFDSLEHGLNKLAGTRKLIDSLNQGDFFGEYSKLNALALNIVEYLLVITQDIQVARQGGAYALLLFLQERSGQERGALNGVFSSGKLDAKQFREISAYVADQELMLKNYYVIVFREDYQELLEVRLREPVVGEVTKLRNAAISKATRNELLNELQEAIGYGGLIHLFKDYILRGDNSYIELFDSLLIRAGELIERYKRLPGNSQHDIALLNVVKETFTEYHAMQIKALSLRDQGYTITEIDNSININDQPALDAIKTLRRSITSLDTSRWWEIATRRIGLIKEVSDEIRGDVTTSIVQSRENLVRSLAIYLALTVFCLVTSFILGRVLLTRLVGEIVGIASKMRKMQQIGNFDEQLVVTGQDEITDMTKAFNTLISERVQQESRQLKLEARLHQSQKMEALGALAGGIAHDFNNILGMISGHAELLQTIVQKGSKEENHSRGIIKACDHAANLVKQIFSFSHIESVKKSAVNIAPLIKEAVDIVNNKLPPSIKIHQKLLEGNIVIMADANQIQQLVINLLTNATHAIEATQAKEEGRHGVIEVTLEHVMGSNEKPGVELTISDTGCGISLDDQERIFEPFYTSKGAEKGTGLGLSIVHRVVKNCNGEVVVESETGKGTRFHVYFPVTNT